LAIGGRRCRDPLRRCPVLVKRRGRDPRTCTRNSHLLQRAFYPHNTQGIPLHFAPDANLRRKPNRSLHFRHLLSGMFPTPELRYACSGRRSPCSVRSLLPAPHSLLSGMSQKKVLPAAFLLPWPPRPANRIEGCSDVATSKKGAFSSFSGDFIRLRAYSASTKDIAHTEKTAGKKTFDTLTIVLLRPKCLDNT